MAIQQPYADLVVRGIKDVENRSSAMPRQLRGQWCAIYASKTLAPVGAWINARNVGRQLQRGLRWPWDRDVQAARKQCTRGAIVGLVRWRDSTTTQRSPWAQSGAYHWTYSERIVLSEPVPIARGCQSLYWYLDAATHSAVIAAVATSGHVRAADVRRAISAA